MAKKIYQIKMSQELASRNVSPPKKRLGHVFNQDFTGGTRDRPKRLASQDVVSKSLNLKRDEELKEDLQPMSFQTECLLMTSTDQYMPALSK